MGTPLGLNSAARCETAPARRRAGTAASTTGRTSTVKRPGSSTAACRRGRRRLSSSRSRRSTPRDRRQRHLQRADRPPVPDATLSGGRAETYGRRYIFGLPDRTTLSTQFRVSYTFKPDVTLDVYAEPFAASGAYRGFGELSVSRGRDLRMYGTDGTTLDRLTDGSYRITDGASTFTLSNSDFNRRSFRSNIVLRWEWRPGSSSTASGSRTARAPLRAANMSASAISSDRFPPRATTSSRSRPRSGCRDDADWPNCRMQNYSDCRIDEGRVGHKIGLYCDLRASLLSPAILHPAITEG